MRRLLQACLCAAVLWLGMMELGGGWVYKGEAARLQDESYAISTVSYEHEAKPLYGVPEQDVQQEASETVPEDAATETAGDWDDQAEFEEAAVVPEGPIIYLTFDDGPSKLTPGVLDILKKENIKATFFVVGEQVQRNPAMAKRIVDEGHAIGNHSFNHVYSELYGSFAKFAEQVRKTDEAIYAATGLRTPLFRAPGGTYTNFDQSLFDAMKEAGFIVHDWNVDSGDSKRRGVPASEIIANVKASKLADPLNVLLHDSGGHEESVKALPEIIRYYKELGYVFKPLAPDVEPKQFATAGRLKWSRSAVGAGEKKQFAGSLAVRDSSFVDETRYAAAASSEAIVRKEPNQAAEAGGNPGLVVTRGQDHLELAEHEYKLIGSAIHVPLAKLMTWIGGEVERDERSGVIEAVWQGQRIFWLAGEQGEGGGLAEEDVLVPIRATIGQFGIGIKDYTYTDSHREIWID